MHAGNTLIGHTTALAMDFGLLGNTLCGVDVF